MTLHLRTWLLALIFGLALGGMAEAKDRRVSGRIVEYICGDNCYLSIKQKNGKIFSALCAARECASWNLVAEMPNNLIGVQVDGVVGTGIQTDGEGNKVKNMDAFKSLTFRP